MPTEKIGGAIHLRDLVYHFRFYNGARQRLQPRDFFRFPSPQAFRCDSISIHLFPEEVS
jgi:hypothetical protein